MRKKPTNEKLPKVSSEWQKIIQAFNDPVLILDKDFRILNVNKATLLFFGKPEKEILGQTCYGLMHNTDTPPAICPTEKIKVTKRREEAELYLPDKDIWVHVTADPLFDTEGNIEIIIHMIRDITERLSAEQAGKQAEEAQQKQHIRTEVLDKTSQILSNVTLDYEGALQTIAQELSELIGDACTLNLLSEDGQFIHTVAVHHPDPDTSAHIRTLMTSSSYHIGAGFMGGVARENKPLLIADMTQEQIRAAMKPELRPYLDHPGLYSMLMVPMHAMGRVMGTVGLTRDKPGRPYTLEDQSLLQELADRAALTIVNARLYDEKIKYQEHLEVLIESTKRSEHQLRLLTDNVPGYIAYIGAHDLCYHFVNQKYEALFGLARDEIIGKHVKDIIGKSNYEFALPYIEKVKSGEEASYDNVFNTLLGKRWLSLNYVPDFNERGEVVGIIILNYDITDRKQAEEALRQAEEKYRSIFENVIEGIFQTTPEGRFLTVNPVLARIYGYSSPEELIETITDIGRQVYVKPNERNEFLRIIQEKGVITGFELQLKRKDGSTFWASINARAVYDENGNVLYCEGTTEDITLRKEAEEKLTTTLESLHRAIGATIQVVVATVEARDPYTAGHQRRVTDLARAIAAELGLSSDRIEGIRMAGSMHDLGKISIPAEILSKPTKLTDIEFSLMKAHAQYGYEILKDVESPWPLAEIVLQHHERLDGSGYPRGLQGNEILMEAKIMAVADVVESMASHRPYRAALGLDAALKEIEDNAGILYDSNAVDVCVKLFREKGFSFE